MFCQECGKEHSQRVNFCCYCGAAMVVSPTRPSKKLMRSRTDHKIAGVCGGFADYLELDVTLVRILWLMVAFVGGWGLIGYLIAWIAMPEEPLSKPASVPAGAPLPHPAGNHGTA